MTPFSPIQLPDFIWSTLYSDNKSGFVQQNDIAILRSAIERKP